MNGAHLHLIVTHLPVLGVLFGTVLLALGLGRGSRGLQQTALIVLVLAGLGAGAAYLTGEGAEEGVERALGAGKAYLDRHEAAALVGLVAAGIAGAIALAVLATGRNGRPFSKGLAIVNLVLGLAASGTLAWVANLGGQIAHSEIRTGQSAPPAEGHEADESH